MRQRERETERKWQGEIFISLQEKSEAGYKVLIKVFVLENYGCEETKSESVGRIGEVRAIDAGIGERSLTDLENAGNGATAAHSQYKLHCLGKVDCRRQT